MGKILFVGAAFIIAIIGFMIKLPSGFRHFDKELHALFYFLAAAFLNLLFAGRSLARHILIFIALYLFGVTIEYAQAYSNKFFHVRIHGRYDIEDIKANIKGLIVFSILWCTYIAFSFIYYKLRQNDVANERE